MTAGANRKNGQGKRPCIFSGSHRFSARKQGFLDKRASL